MPRPLTFIILTDDYQRLHGGLSTASAMAALGRSVAIHFQGQAVRAVRSGRRWPEDAAARVDGTPTLTDLFAALVDLDVKVTACETGMASAGMTASDIGDDIETVGLVALLSRPERDLMIV